MGIPRWLLKRYQIPGWLAVIWAIVVIAREIIGVAGDIDFLKSQDWGWGSLGDVFFHPGFLLLILLAGVMWLLFIGPRLYLRGSYIKGERVYIADLVRNMDPKEPAIIRGKTFEECEIIGPAALVATKGLFGLVVSSSFDAPFDAVFIPVEQGRSMVGVIGLQDCVIKKCTMKRISIIGTPDAIAEWRKHNLDVLDV